MFSIVILLLLDEVGEDISLANGSGLVAAKVSCDSVDCWAGLLLEDEVEGGLEVCRLLLLDDVDAVCGFSVCATEELAIV